MKKVVVIGGGSGAYTTLMGLKNYQIKLSAIISMMDSGGSSGKLRDAYGVLPPGDLRQSMVALSTSNHIWRKLFTYRFESGDFKGHNFGNVFFAALESIEPDYNEVTKTAEMLLQTSGKVIPVTLDKSHLVVEFEDGKKIITEDSIDKSGYKKSRIKKAYLEPKAKINHVAKKALEEADYIVIGPGDLYTSLIPNLLVSGVPEAISNSKAKVFYVANLMTKSGQSTGYKTSDHVKDLEKYLKRGVDYVVINSMSLPESAILHYQKDGEIPVVDDLENSKKAVRGDLVSDVIHSQSKADTALRSIVRHDSNKLAQLIINTIKSERHGINKIKDILGDVRSYIVD
jgi:uncharacterized cofD-like protein